MTNTDYSQLSDEELLEHAKKARNASMGAAFVIGFMIAVVIYSIFKETWGLVTLIPLFFIYKLTRRNSGNEALEKVLRERGLKK